MSTKPVIVPIVVDDKTGQAFVQLNDKLLQMKSRASETMNTMRGDTEKARSSIALLGEDLGIKIPRHLQTLIAESSLAKVALQAAFGGVAVFAFIDVLKQLPAAIDKITGELTGWNDEAKKAYQAQVELNDLAVKGLEQVQETLEQNKLIGLDGAQRFAQEEKNKQDEIQRTTEKLKEQTAEILNQQKIQENKPSLTDIFASGFSPSAIAAGYATYAGAKITQSEAMKPEQLDKLRTSAQETKNQLDNLKASAQGVAKEYQDAFNTELIDRVIQGWKDLEDVQKAVQQRDSDIAAMMKAMAGDGKILASVLSVPTTQVLTIQDVANKIQRALEAEKAQENELQAAAKASGDTQLQIEQKLEPLRRKTADDLQETVQYYRDLAAASKDPSLIDQANKMGSELDTLRVKAQTLADVMKTNLKTQFEGAFTDMILQTKSVSQAFKEMAASIIADLVKMILEMYVFKAVSGLIGGFFGGSSGNGVVAALPGGGTSVGAIDMSGLTPHAAGGPVSPGMAYLVGENGPEPFIPSSAGTILPNDFMKRGNVYNIDARNAQPGVERDIMRAIKASENNAVVRSVRAIDSRAKRRG